ncbi:MAG: hypothetical protein J5543_10305 [Bacteroidales bacterium]|nr:hypothetical protein [Bacteroidales bacterium]
MNLPPIVIAKLEERTGVSLGNPSDRDIQILSRAIEDATKSRLGVNTLKRLLGRIADDTHQSRPGTLNVIAQYLGSANWPALLISLSNGSSSFNSIDGELRTADLVEGQVVEITYLPNRRLHFLYRGNEEFELVVNEYSKLKVGDICTISSFILRYPLIIRNVVRHGVVFGSYSAARAGGISAIKVLK